MVNSMNPIECLTCLAVTRVTDLVPDYQQHEVESSFPVLTVCLAVVVLAILACIILFLKRTRLVELPNSDPLVASLYTQHQMSLHHRVLLDQVAHAAALDHAAEMFLSEAMFHAAVETASTKIRLGWFRRAALNEIRTSLFPSSGNSGG